jgi:hypothetical protein
LVLITPSDVLILIHYYSVDINYQVFSFLILQGKKYQVFLISSSPIPSHHPRCVCLPPYATIIRYHYPHLPRITRTAFVFLLLPFHAESELLKHLHNLAALVTVIVTTVVATTVTTSKDQTTGRSFRRRPHTFDFRFIQFLGIMIIILEVFCLLTAGIAVFVLVTVTVFRALQGDSCWKRIAI